MLFPFLGLLKKKEKKKEVGCKSEKATYAKGDCKKESEKAY